MLAELLIVIAVATVLLTAGLALLNPSKQINRGNDAKRKADLITLQSAMERYYADTGDYPGTIGWCSQISNVSNSQVRDALGNYLKKIPKDPKYADTTSDYYYWHSAPGEYHLYVVLENTTDPDVAAGAVAADGGAAAGCTGTAYNSRGGSYTALALAHTPTPIPTNTPIPTATNTPTPTVTPTPTPKFVQFDAQSNSGTEISAATVSWSHTVSGSSRLLLVGVVTELSKTVTATWKGTEAFAHVTSSPQGISGSRYAYLLYLKNPTTGAGTIQVNLNSSDNLKAGAVSLKEVHQTTTFGTTVFVNTSGTTVSTGAIASENTGMIVDVVAAASNTGVSTPGGGQTSFWDTIGGTSNPSGSGSYKIGQTSTTMSWSWGTSKSAVIIAVPVKAAP